MRNNVTFFLTAFIFMYVGRRLGWVLSKGFFYGAPALLSFIGVVVWGIVVGCSMSGLICCRSSENVVF